MRQQFTHLENRIGPKLAKVDSPAGRGRRSDMKLVHQSMKRAPPRARQFAVNTLESPKFPGFNQVKLSDSGHNPVQAAEYMVHTLLR